MLRGHWREADTPHTVQYVLTTMVVWGIIGDVIALVFTGLSVWASRDTGVVLFWIAQWWAYMVPAGLSYIVWVERGVFWRQYRARARRTALQRAEFKR